MYEITINRTFSAAHAIRLYDGSLEPVHGHNWMVALTIESEELDDIEVVMDFHELEQMVDQLIVQVDGRNLNDVRPFAADGGLRINPTAERVAWWLATQVQDGLPAGARLDRVSVGEAPGCVATYRPE